MVVARRLARTTSIVQCILERKTSMFQMGDSVTVKQLTENDRQCDFFNNDTMPPYEQQTGTVTYVETDKKHHGFRRQNQYRVRFKDGKSWWWLEEWLEPPIYYNAF